MMRIYLLLVFLLMSASGIAQDTLFVREYNGKWMADTYVQFGDDVFIMSKRFHVPPAMFADANNITFQDGLEKGTIVHIPLGSFNQVYTLPADKGTKELYYIVQDHDNLFRISRYAGVPQKTMQEWNGLSDNSIETGQRLFIGWVLYDETKVAFANDKEKPSVDTAALNELKRKMDAVVYDRDSVPLPLVSGDEQEYLVQTSNEMNVIEERGPGVFFKMVGKVGNTKKFFAFHNTASAGTIIKVVNPATQKFVFVKVLGPIPGTKQYANSIIGISSGAKAALGVRDSKGWVELKYAGY